MTYRSPIGQTIGKYRLEESLGRRGMAEVYRACQKNFDRNNVAIKIMHAFLAEEEGFPARFQREAKAIGCIEPRPHCERLRFRCSGPDLLHLDGMSVGAR